MSKQGGRRSIHNSLPVTAMEKCAPQTFAPTLTFSSAASNSELPWVGTITLGMSSQQDLDGESSPSSSCSALSVVFSDSTISAGHPAGVARGLVTATTPGGGVPRDLENETFEKAVGELGQNTMVDSSSNEYPSMTSRKFRPSWGRSTSRPFVGTSSSSSLSLSLPNEEETTSEAKKPVFCGSEEGVSRLDPACEVSKIGSMIGPSGLSSSSGLGVVSAASSSSVVSSSKVAKKSSEKERLPITDNISARYPFFYCELGQRIRSSIAAVLILSLLSLALIFAFSDLFSPFAVTHHRIFYYRDGKADLVCTFTSVYALALGVVVVSLFQLLQSATGLLGTSYSHELNFASHALSSSAAVVAICLQVGIDDVADLTPLLGLNVLFHATVYQLAATVNKAVYAKQEEFGSNQAVSSYSQGDFFPNDVGGALSIVLTIKTVFACMISVICVLVLYSTFLLKLDDPLSFFSLSSWSSGAPMAWGIVAAHVLHVTAEVAKLRGMGAGEGVAFGVGVFAAVFQLGAVVAIENKS